MRLPWMGVVSSSYPQVFDPPSRTTQHPVGEEAVGASCFFAAILATRLAGRSPASPRSVTRARGLQRRSLPAASLRAGGGARSRGGGDRGGQRTLRWLAPVGGPLSEEPARHEARGGPAFGPAVDRGRDGRSSPGPRGGSVAARSPVVSGTVRSGREPLRPQPLLVELGELLVAALDDRPPAGMGLVHDRGGLLDRHAGDDLHEHVDHPGHRVFLVVVQQDVPRRLGASLPAGAPLASLPDLGRAHPSDTLPHLSGLRILRDRLPYDRMMRTFPLS